MSETTTAPEAPVVPLPEVSISRNGLNLALSDWKIVKGNNKGNQYKAPAVTSENLAQYIQWAGEKHVLAVLQKDAKVTFQGIWFDSFKEDTGEFLLPKFVEEGSKFDQSGLKIKEIDDLIDEATERQLQLMAGGLDPATGGFTVEASRQLLETRELLMSYRAMREERSNKKKKSDSSDAAPAVQVK